MSGCLFVKTSNMLKTSPLLTFLLPDHCDAEVETFLSDPHGFPGVLSPPLLASSCTNPA